MTGKRIWMPAIIALAVTGCSLPQFGPTHARMVSTRSAEEGNFTLIEGAEYIRSRNAAPTLGGFPASFTGGGSFNTDIISPGDQLALTIFENVQEGVFATAGVRTSALQNVQVSQKGEIYIPYAGNLRVAGRSVEAARQSIVAALEDQTPDPQVALSRLPGAGASVTLLGAIAAQGVYPIEVNTTRLSEMIAKAGGATQPLEEIIVKVERGGQRGSARLSFIAESPTQNIALRPGDRITLVQDSQSITVLGAAGGQGRVPVASYDYLLIDLLGDVGGLSGEFANPRGVFVYRTETVNNVLLQEIIQFDLADPAGIFAARSFYMRDGDTVYISEAPIRNVQKLFSTITGVATSADSLANVGTE
jgi:polysaccharide export outer membrane protein